MYPRPLHYKPTLEQNIRETWSTFTSKDLSYLILQEANGLNSRLARE